MMKKQTLTGVTLIAMAISSATAMADEGRANGRFMKYFDTNADGSVDMAEFKIAAAERFKKMDADNDGIVSKDEFRSHMRARKDERKEKSFARMDTNGNGSIERDEFLAHKKARAERKFTRMDKDANGSVSKEEYASCKKRKYDKKGMLKRIDTNGDGQVTRDESLSAWTKWFKYIDANNDQVVTADEVKAYGNKLHGKRDGHQ